MKFFIGIAIGVVGMWAYSNGKLQGLIGQAPQPVNQTFSAARERVSQVANNEQVQGFVATAQDRLGDAATRERAPKASEPTAGTSE